MSPGQGQMGIQGKWVKDRWGFRVSGSRQEIFCTAYLSPLHKVLFGFQGVLFFPEKNFLTVFDMICISFCLHFVMFFTMI